MTNEKDLEHHVDKTLWPAGPWMDEPDRVEWRYRDYPCLIVRNRLGNLCGYAGVNESHPYFERDYGALQGPVDVHRDRT